MNRLNKQRSRFKWEVVPFAKPEYVIELAEKLNINPIVVNILIQRGLDTEDKIRKVLNPELDTETSPFKIKDMDKAVSRIIEAINNKQKILVFGDYDVDGTTSVALMSFFLKYVNHPFEFYTPDRHTEGYGLSKNAVDFAIQNNCKLIITLDCGTKEREPIEYAKQNNIDVIVIDHHEITDLENISKPYALVNPKHPECEYPFKHFSACGVAFKVLQALNIKGNFFFPVEEYLDLVALSTICDITPLKGENYAFAKLGIKKLKTNPLPGIKKLMEVSGIKNYETLSEFVLGYQLGPRINAAGRMSDAKQAVKLFLGDTEMAYTLNKQNVARQDKQRQTLVEAEKQLQNEDLSNKIIILADASWDKAIVGIVASKLLEKYYKPVIIIGGDKKDPNLMTGSCRSIPGFDITQALENFKHLLERFGGHKAAAGFTIHKDNFPQFKQMLTQFANDVISEEMLVPVMVINSPLPFHRINMDLVESIMQLAPFGEGNPLPVFRSTNVEILRQFPLKSNPESVMLKLRQKRHIFSGIFWNGYKFFPELAFAERVNITYSLEIWNSKQYGRSIKLKIRDLEIIK